jgi:hypothetical protein
MNNKLILSSALLSFSIQASAADDIGMVEALSGFNINETSFIKERAITTGLWISAGETGNSNSNTNAPVGFNDNVNKFDLNELNFYVERSVYTKGNSWDVGGRMDVMYGTDARFTQATGWDADWNNGGEYNIAMPQLYVEVFAPFGNGITAKLGHFYTTIGNEVVTAPDNFFYSHSYTMLYAEPFTHTGALLSYDIDANFSVNGGMVVGWDNMSDVGSGNFLGGVSWTNDSKSSSITMQLISGEQNDKKFGNTTMYSIVATHDFSDKLHYLIQHDFGREDDGAGSQNHWYGINQYIIYDIYEDLSIGFRGEWFNDVDSARVSTTGANYVAGSVGLNYSLTSWFKVRPEIRYDRADENVFNEGTSDEQIAISMDMIVIF